MSTFTPAMKLVMDLSALHSKMLKRLESQLSIHGISFTEFLVMYQLNQAPGNMMRRIELAESVGLSASGVTRLLVPMEKRKMVQRQANTRDARVSLVQLSDAGRQLFEDALITFNHASTALVQALDGEQLDQVIELVGKLK